VSDETPDQRLARSIAAAKASLAKRAANRARLNASRRQARRTRAPEKKADPTSKRGQKRRLRALEDPGLPLSDEDRAALAEEIAGTPRKAPKPEPTPEEKAARQAHRRELAAARRAKKRAAQQPAPYAMSPEEELNDMIRLREAKLVRIREELKNPDLHPGYRRRVLAREAIQEQEIAVLRQQLVDYKAGRIRFDRGMQAHRVEEPKAEPRQEDEIEAAYAQRAADDARRAELRQEWAEATQDARNHPKDMERRIRAELALKRLQDWDHAHGHTPKR
jgi:hypothetical protein